MGQTPDITRPERYDFTSMVGSRIVDVPIGYIVFKINSVYFARRKLPLLPNVRLHEGQSTHDSMIRYHTALFIPVFLFLTSGSNMSHVIECCSRTQKPPGPCLLN